MNAPAHPPASLPTFDVFNPADGTRIGALPDMDTAAVEAAAARARAAQRGWAEVPLVERARHLTALRRVLVKERAAMMDTIVRETGKTRMDALIEVFTTCETLDYLAKRGPRLLASERRGTGLFVHKRGWVNYQPWGVVGVISPWNYPLVLTATPLASAVMAGNGVLVKPSEVTPYTGLRLGELIERARWPRDLVQMVTGQVETGKAIVASTQTDMICFTGSTATGRKIGEVCGRMLKPALLELGGKDPMIVFDDADPVRAARGALWGGVSNSGQTCIAVERVYVQRGIYRRFLDALQAELPKLRQGSGHDPSVSVGSMTFPKQVELVESQFADARARGATFVAGGRRTPGMDQGLFVEPTIIADVNHDMAVMRDETFGPMIAIMAFDSEDEAIALANDNVYGLNSSVWTSDVARGRRVAQKIQAGSVCINDALANYLVGDLPFGGMKASGLGRVHGPEGLRAFAQLQSVLETVPAAARLGKEPWWFPYDARTMGLFERAMTWWYG
jgi:succinate-semialdehyde dehydrogenase/glutarate-semialdehyde dehydrogenase